MTIVLAAAAAALFGCGTFLLLQRQLTRVLVGLALLSHGANLLIVLAAGGRGTPTFVGDGDEALLDPLPQAFVLTAIVITFGVTSFLLALAYRSWQLTGDDEVQDDVEDRLVASRWPVSEELADVEAAAAAAHDDDMPGRHQVEEIHR
jgi:multicomponent Na+:H+ antiporter subunit C